MNPAKPMPIVHRLLQVGLLLACLGWITPQAAHGQTDLELAEFYYNEGSYPQAKLYLEGIWKKNKTNASEPVSVTFQDYRGTKHLNKADFFLGS